MDLNENFKRAQAENIAIDFVNDHHKGRGGCVRVIMFHLQGLVEEESLAMIKL